MPRAKPESIDSTKPIQFLVIDWFECDIKNHDVESEGEHYLLNEHDKNYVIYDYQTLSCQFRRRTEQVPFSLEKRGTGRLRKP